MENNVPNYIPPRRGGRPSQLQASEISERILNIATDLFLREGYGATSIESIARRAGISKRTFYHRFDDKAALFGAVVHRLIARLRPANTALLFEGGTLEEILRRLAKIILHAALSSEALALHRLVMAEGMRFRELAMIVDAEGSRREAVKHIAGLLQRQAHPDNAALAAEQFLQMVVSLPQRNASLGAPMTQAELDEWVNNAVQLFLHGCRA